MRRIALLLALAVIACTQAQGQTMTLRIQSSDYQLTPNFSDVDFFDIKISIDAELTPGTYINPNIIEVDYQVMGDLEPNTPSDFPAFNLERTISGNDFYAQGSSLSFEIAQNAILEDGVQVAELVGTAILLTFNGREIDNGRYHPALLELNANGTGRIQNSNNIPSENPLVEVDFGEEYITDLNFDPGNTTVITATPANSGLTLGGSGGGGSLSSLGAAFLGLMILVRAFKRRNAK